MSKLRVYELARELNVETKVMMAKLKSLGHNITNHQSTLTDQQIADLRKVFAQGNVPAGAPTSVAGKPKVVVRRRATTAGGDQHEEQAEASVQQASAAMAAEEAVQPVAAPRVELSEGPEKLASAEDSQKIVESLEASTVESDLPAESEELKESSIEPSDAHAQQASASSINQAEAEPVETDSALVASMDAAASSLTESTTSPMETGSNSVSSEQPSATVVQRAQPAAPRRGESGAVIVSRAPTKAPPIRTGPVAPQIAKQPTGQPPARPSATVAPSTPASVPGTSPTRSSGATAQNVPGAPVATPQNAAAAGRPTPSSMTAATQSLESSSAASSRGRVEHPRPAGAGASGGSRTSAAQGQPQQKVSGPAGPSDEQKGARRREVSGATIVRRATQEEREKLEGKGRSAAGRKEDNRGTRVTGMGLLSNRISTPDQNKAPIAPPFETAEETSRRASGSSLKDRKATEDEEIAKKKAAAKARRSNVTLTTRALLEQAEDIIIGPETFDEDGAAAVGQGPAVNRTVYTPTASRSKRDLKRRKDLKKTQITTPRAAYRVVEMEEFITVSDLARQLTVKASEIIKKLMSQGVMATINQPLDVDTATLIAQEYQFEVKSKVQTVEDILGAKIKVDDSRVESRPPIVTVMGHVDHGKTSILDAIRSADVASGEAGGITQHIGAYTVEHHQQKITFLDTPGHEAFSAMRARGASVTDIVVLVVAADDGVMPQTIEAISHAKAANVPIIVAVNKIDKPNINFDRIYTELNTQGVQAEEWGGDVQFVKCSALQKTGISELLDAILLQAEVLDLKARAEGFAEGSVIEAHLDKGRGPVATVVVQAGTLQVGDFIVAGMHVGRVRAMSDYKGGMQSSATPSIPVEIIGLSGVPMAGDRFNAVVDEKTARDVADHRLEATRKAQQQKSSAQRLEDLLAKVKSDEIPEVVFIVKADTQGSAEAIQESILKLSTAKVKNRIVHCAVGGISESDVTLAAASGAIIIGFNVRAARGLDDFATKEGVVVQYFGIIYEIVDAVKAIMVGKLPPVVSEVVLGHAEIRKLISVPKMGTIGGSAVLDGKITRSSLCRLIRNQIVIFSGKIGSLRRFKDDVKEVAQGYECGIGIDGYNDIREGDVVEAYALEESAATL